MRMPAINWGSFGTIADATMATLARFSFTLPFTWHGLGALILGVLLAKWFWVFFAPLAIFTATIPEQTASTEAGRLFGIAVANEADGQGVALPNVQLLGLFSATGGKPGFAILKLDEKRQLGVAEGAEVVPGTKLVAVNVDHILLERAGMQQKVSLEIKIAALPLISNNNFAGNSFTGNKTNSNAPLPAAK